MLNLLDSENDGIGLNMFNESIDDPQATNALNCNIIGDMDDILNVLFFPFFPFFPYFIFLF